MIRILTILIAMFMANSPVFADSNSEFYVEEGLVAKIFGETSKSTVVRKSKGTTIVPMIGVLKPNTLRVMNKYFSTDYSQIDSLPYLYFMAEGKILHFEGSELLWNASIGYGYVQQNISTNDTSGLTLSDTVSLQWMPFELSSRYRINSIFTPGLSASFDVGAGRLWLHQDGNIDGFDQGYFTSYASIGSTTEMKVSESVKILGQISYFTDLQKDSNYRGWKLGVGAWLSI